MADKLDCITKSVVDSINRNDVIDLSSCDDDRDNIIEGDIVATLFFNDPRYRTGKLEDMDGRLGIPIEKGVVGLVENAHQHCKNK